MAFINDEAPAIGGSASTARVSKSASAQSAVIQIGRHLAMAAVLGTFPARVLFRSSDASDQLPVWVTDQSARHPRDPNLIPSMSNSTYLSAKIYVFDLQG
jgi:hypothetical protein